MDRKTAFNVESFDYVVQELSPVDTPVLQQLYEQCADYNYLMDGQPHSPTAALDEFTSLPEGRSLEDKSMLGIFDSQGQLVGLIEGMRNYPEDKRWWVGLIMLSPQQRRTGVLTPVMRSFER